MTEYRSSYSSMPVRVLTGMRNESDLKSTETNLMEIPHADFVFLMDDSQLKKAFLSMLRTGSTHYKVRTAVFMNMGKWKVTIYDGYADNDR